MTIDRISLPTARRKRCRRNRLRDERGSMAILMMVVLVGLSLCALLIPMIITQDRTTRLDSTRLQALGAAQGGIDVMLGSIRAGISNGIGDNSKTSYGDSSKLPCGPRSGTVNGAGNASYSVVVEYFVLDPVTEPYPSPLAMKCVAGFGTFDPTTGATTPGFARFTSTGTDGAAPNGSTAGRTLTATYVFRTSNANILGGLLKIPRTGSDSFCVDAGAPIPPAGTPVVLQVCSESTPPSPQQVFAYRTDLTVQLLSSITAANPNGLCLSSTTSAGLGNDARLVQCGTLGVPSFTQQWSYNNAGQYQAAQENSAATGLLPNLCMNVSTQAPGQAVVLGSCGSDWIPSATVGPGAAALPQWINFNEFGRCLDVTLQDPHHNFLINFPCEQNPFRGAKKWDQLFTAPPIPTGEASVTGQISTTRDDANPPQQYCLTSPGTVGGYVTIKTCDGLPRQTWTIYGGDKTLNYSTKYTLVNGSLCLGLSVPNVELPAWSTIDVENCNGSTEQKWNAVPNLLSSTLINTHEK